MKSDTQHTVEFVQLYFFVLHYQPEMSQNYFANDTDPINIMTINVRFRFNNIVAQIWSQSIIVYLALE